MGLRPARPVDNGPQEGDYSDWVAWEKGKVETRKTSQEPDFSFPPGYPARVVPLLWPIICRAPWPEAHLILLYVIPDALEDIQPQMSESYFITYILKLSIFKLFLKSINYLC